MSRLNNELIALGAHANFNVKTLCSIQIFRVEDEGKSASLRSIQDKLNLSGNKYHACPRTAYEPHF